MSDDRLPAAPGAEQLPELRGGGATEPNAVPTLRTTQRRARKSAVVGKEVARVAGREDIELAVAASGLKLGDTVTATGVITYLSADSKGNVWMRVAFERSWSGVDLWAGSVDR